MIKKIIIISAIGFFAFAGNVFAYDIWPSGNVFENETFPDCIDNDPGYIVYPEPLFSIPVVQGWRLPYLSDCTIINPDFGIMPPTWQQFLIRVARDDNIPYPDLLNLPWRLRLSVYGDPPGVYHYSSIIIRPAGWIPPILSMPETASSDLLANVGGLFTDFWPIIAMMFGIPLAFYIIPRVIELVVVKDKS